MKIAIGSDNPVKIGAAYDAFALAYDSLVVRTEYFSVDSCVPANPIGDVQCIQGARNRAYAAMQSAIGADVAVGMESGICFVSYGGVNEGWFERTWAFVLDREGRVGVGSGGSFRVPEHVATHIRTRQSGLGRIADACTGLVNTKKEMGYCGIITEGVLCRRQENRDAITAAIGDLRMPAFFRDPELLP